MANKKQDQPYQLPKALLNMLNEHVNGGYMLFYVDDEGNFDIVQDFDSNVYSAGLQNFVQKYANAMNDLNQASMTQELLEGFQDEDGNDDLEDEEVE